MTAQSTRSLNTFRIHLALTSAIVTASFALVIGAALFAPLAAQMDQGGLERAALAGVAEYLLHLHASYWPVVTAMILASITAGLMLFRRMAAPLVRFVRVFEAVSRGDLPGAVRVRRLDYLNPEAAAMNAMVASLAERAEAQRSSLARLEAAIEELEGCDPEPKAAARLTEIRDALGALESTLLRRA